MFCMMVLLPLGASAQIDSLIVKTDSSDVRHQVLLQTSKGDIVIELYNETPLHRDNFLRLVRSGYYDGVLWHRVIADFMIQTGDSTTRHAKPGEFLGGYSPDYQVDAEFRYPKYFHKRGAVAAAREPNDVNPEMKSSSAQFYIVWGQVYTPRSIERAKERLAERSEGKVEMNDQVADTYIKRGGTPHLDGTYTVFGEVVKGLNVVGDIDYVKTDSNDRPLEDVKIIKAVVIK